MTALIVILGGDFLITSNKENDFMKIIEWIKLIAECIAAVNTAIIVLQTAYEKVPVVKGFFLRIKHFLHLFFKGFTNLDGKKVKGFKAIKADKERRQAIINGIAPDLEYTEVFVLNQSKLQQFLSKSDLFTKMTVRKK